MLLCKAIADFYLAKAAALNFSLGKKATLKARNLPEGRALGAGFSYWLGWF